MAGKLQVAAKLFLSTTVLAGGGAGTYYGATVGWPAIERFVSGDKVASEVESQASSSADLDALADAWAEPAAPSKTMPTDFSPIARTAESSPSQERYALATEQSVKTETATANQVEESNPEVLSAEANLLADESSALEPADESNETVLDAELTPTSPVARGQEPIDDLAQRFDAEPQAMVVSGEEQSIESPNQANAFSNRAATNSGDRYGAPSTQGREPSIVNPFSAGEAAPPASANTVEPLAALPEEAGGGLAELPPDEGIQPLAESPRTARTSSGSRAAVDASVASQFESSSANPIRQQAALDRSTILSSSAVQSDEGTGRPGERALEGVQRPALEIQKFAPPEIQVGKPAKFIVQVRNVGSQPADNVIIRDEVPQGTQLISTNPTAQTVGGKLQWDLGKLSPGEDRSVEMQLIPTTEGDLGSVASVSYSAQASVKTRCTMPQLAIRMTAPSKVLIGQEQRVKIELRNPGSGDASGVMLFENVPPNVRHAAGPALEFEIGTLRAGETRELELVLLAEKPGKTVNVLHARADGNLQIQQQVEFEVIAPALAIDVNGPERRYLERPATYEVSVENPGTAPAHNVQIVTKLPKGMRFVRANNLGEYDSTSHAVYWSLAELPEGERGTVELIAMPIETGQQTLQVEGRSADGLTDETQRQIVVDGLAAIMFEVRDLEDPIEVGGETGYEIRIVNQGTKAATNVQVVVSLPAGLQFVSAEGETQYRADRRGILFEPIPQLAAKADTVYRIRAQGTQAGDQRVLVEVSTDDMAQPIRREESTRVFGDE